MAEKEATLTVDDLLLPGTPQSVRERYLTLAERARTQDFGLLEEDVVVLDTETTGLSFSDCHLIEISAARLSGRELADAMDTFVHPGVPIPPEIVRLTGITNRDVQDAPRAEDAVAQLADFVGGMPVLAHNATFDRTFVEAVHGGREVSDTWIDTLALSRMALPRLRSHRLADMAQAFGVAPVTHRSSDDVAALCGMWRIILCALSDLPNGLLQKLADMHPEVDWSFRPILSHLALAEAGSTFSLRAVRSSLVSEAEAPVRDDCEELLHPQVPSADEVRAAFEPGGLVSRMYDTYEVRPEQVQMAEEVRSALEAGEHRAIEAGTGVGKSVAYLLPEVLFAKRNGVTVGVATKTNALTDQLVSHELPALAKVLPGGLTFHSLKGYDHYPCLHALDVARRADLPVDSVQQDGRSEQAIAADQLTAIAVTYAFCCQSPDGDLDALGIRWRYVPRQLLTTTPDECLRNRCPYFPNECLVHGARRRAGSSDVVVTNHSLLLRNVMSENKLLPPVRNWVVDEAHGFEAEARRQWAREVCADDVRAAFERLGGVKTGAIHGLLVDSTALEASTLVAGLLTKLAAAVSRASVCMGDLFLAVHGLSAVAPGGGGYDNVALWIDANVRASDAWGAVAAAGESAIQALEAANKAMGEAQVALAAQAPQKAAELKAAGSFLHGLFDDVRLICSGEDETYVYSAQLFRSKRRMGQEKLVAEKLDVGSDLGEAWLPEMRSVVFASATMAVGDDFSHFDHAVGLDAPEAGAHHDVRLDSSFDFDDHMSVIVARDMPVPNDRDYLRALEDLLFDVHVAMGGSVLTLFTNRREMEQVYEGLAPRLAAEGLELASQERGSSPRRLRERFVADKSLSLLALKSFWEGFDASGDTLRCVVIPKLPFAAPSDPLVRERDLREQRAWWKYSLPDAVISVKQAAGRLIRTGTDTGVLVLADSRLVSKRYGRQFLSSLPSQSQTQLERANVGRYITMWRASHE